MYSGSVFLFTLAPQTQKLLHSKLTAHVYDPMHPKNLSRHNCKPFFPEQSETASCKSLFWSKSKKGIATNLNQYLLTLGYDWCKNQNYKRFNNPTSTTIKQHWFLTDKLAHVAWARGSKINTEKINLCSYNHMKNELTTHVEKPIRFKTVSIRNRMLLNFLAGQADQLTARIRKGSTYKRSILAIGRPFSECFWENGP